MQARLALAEQLVAEGAPNRMFFERFVELWPSVDERTVWRYKANALESIRVRREAERAHDIDARLHRLTHLSNKLEREGAYAPMMRAEELLAKITGVMEPDKHLHLHAAPQAAQAPSPVQYREIPDHVLDLLETALRAAQVPSISAGVVGVLPAYEKPNGEPPANFGEGSGE